MKNIVIYILLALLPLLTFVNKGWATHAMGGDIWYECNSGNIYTIYYAFYRDCDGVNAPNTITIDITSSCAGPSQLILTRVPGTGQDITPTCDGQPSNCSGGTYPGVQKYVYSAQVSLAPCADWSFSESICCRNNAITNIANPGSEQMYIQATLDNLNNPCNSSPTFSSDPVPYVCVGQTFCFNHGAIDSEGDSMAFHLVTPFDQNSSTTVNYNAGFSPTQPISSSPAITFNSQNGDICMTPSSQEVSVTAVVVEHWSNGQLVGTIMRDIQIRVINCNNQIPTTNGIDATTNYSTSACAGSPLLFNTYGTDNDAGNLLTMSWNGAIPGATFTVANNGTTNPVGTFSWTPTLADVSANPYCFTVTVMDDACPLNGFQTFAYCITVGGGTIEALATATDPNCNAGCDGQIVAAVNGGSPNFSYSIDGVNFSSSDTFTGLCSGTYDVFVQDANNCTDVTQVDLIDPPPIVIASSSSDVSCFGANDGVLNVVASGGTPGYTYFWTGGATTSNVTNASAGWYSVAVTDANGCVRIQSVFVTEPTELITNVASTNTSCAGNDGTITLNTTGGVPPYSYNWSHNPGLNSNSASGLTPGQYSVIVTDASGCATTSNITISVVGSVTTGFTYNGNQCLSGNSYTFTNLGSTGAVYSWNFGDGIGTSSNENPTYSYATSGAYLVQQTITEGVCSATTTINVLVYAEPSLSASLLNPRCNGFTNGSINLSVSGGTPAFSYNWSNGATTQDISGLGVGTYTVSVSDLNNCQATTSYVLTQPSVFSLITASTDAFCQGVCDGTAIVNGNGGTAPYNFLWDDPANQSGQNAISLCSGSYTVTGVDAKGCIATAVETIGFTNPISITASIVNSNCGQADGEIIANVNNGTSPYTYLWSPGGSMDQTLSLIPAGVYDLSVSDFNGCSLDTAINLVDNAAPTISIASFTDALCYADSSGSATASATGGIGGYSFTWSPFGGNSVFASGLPVGSYSVSVEDDAGCIASTSVAISEPTAIQATLNSVNANCGQPDGEVNVTVSGGTVSGAYQYSWLDESSFVGNIDTIQGVTAGNYYLFVTDDNGCVLKDSIIVSDNPKLKIETTSLNISCFGRCDGEASVISVTGGIPPYSYQWNDPGLPVSDAVIGLCEGAYIVYVEDAVGCILSDTMTIIEPQPVTIVEDRIIHPTCFGFNDGEISLHAEGGTPNYTYQWDAAANNQTDTLINGLGDGDYVIIATDINGCTGSNIITLTEPEEMILSGNPTKAHCNLPDGQAEVIISSGGFVPFSYSWTGSSSTTSIASGLDPGFYTAIVTDVNGCQKTIGITVGNIPEGIATISFTSNPSCLGSCDGTATVSMSGTGTSPYSYSWNNINNDNSVTATGLCGGVNYQVMVTDANGCTSQASTTVTDPAALSLSILVKDATCNGECSGELKAQVTGGTGPYTFLWDAFSQTTQTAVGLCANTNYSVTVTDANGCQISGSSSLGQPSLVVLDSTVTNSNCGQSNGSACIGITGGVTPYVTSWAYNGSASLCQSNISSGTYLVSVADGNDCFKQIAVTVTDVEGPTASIQSLTNVSCAGYSDGQATASVNGTAVPFTYLWDANTGSQTTPTASNLPVGAYTVLVTDSAGCIASTSVNIVEPTPIDLGGTITNPLCWGYSNGAIALNVLGGTPSYNYLWQHNTTLNSSIATGLSEGNYNVEVSDNNGCSELISFTLTNPVPVSTTLTQVNPTCFSSCNGSVTATPITGFPPYQFNWNDSNQQTGATASALCAGTYSVIVTDAHGCLDTVQTTVTEPTLLTSSILVSGNTSCFGACDGYAMVDVQGGKPPYSYQWSNGDITQVSQNLCAGTYVVVITDANSCVTFSQVVIKQPTQISINPITANASCYGVCDGSAQVVVTGGTAPYGYQWNDPNLQTTSTITGLCAGTFQIAITDANDCYYSNNVTIGQPSLLSMVSSTANANCGQSNGSACVSVIGGVSPYSYYWSDPSNQQTSCAFNLPSGSYVATITDGNSCQVQSIVSINDISGPSISLLQTTDAICANGNSGSIQTDVNGGTLPYSVYHWINNSTGAQTGPINNPNLPGISAGCYTLEVVDAVGCQTSLTACITEPPQLNLTVTNIVDATCNGGCDGMATALYVGGTAPYSLLWDNGQTSVLASGLCSGNHDVSVTDGNNCLTTSNVYIDQPLPVNTTQTGGGITSCDGSCDGVIALNTQGGTAPYFFTWLPNVSNSSVASGLCEGTYTVQTIDGNGCVLLADFQVTSPLPLQGTITSTNATCGNCNGTATLTGSGGTTPYSYIWNNGQTSQTANTLCSGPIGGTIIDVNGCQVDRSATINNIAGPAITNMTGYNPTCNGSLNGIAVVTLSGGTSPFTYSWTQSAVNQPTALFLAAGTHCVEITDANGCTDMDCLILTEPSSVVAVVDGQDSICFGDSVQVWASASGGNGGPYTISWLPPDTDGFMGQGPIMVKPSMTTDYCFNAADVSGCISSDPGCIEVFVYPSLSLNVNSQEYICPGDTVVFNTITSGGSGGSYNFEWYVGSVDSLNSIGSDSVLTISSDTSVTYYIILDDGCSLPNLDSIELIVNPNPNVFIELLDSSGCYPYEAQFSVVTDVSTEISWDFECDGEADFTTLNTVSGYTYTEPGIYDLCVTVVSDSGCISTAYDSAAIEVYPVPVANFALEPPISTTLQPEIFFNNQSFGDSIWRWDLNGDGLVDDTLTHDPSYVFNNVGEYQITLIVENEYGCKDVHVETLIMGEDQAIYVPNTFTPNNDGYNDYFYAEVTNIVTEGFELLIFNRWGEFIWGGYTPDAKWDGRIYEKIVQQDTYIWKIRYRDLNGNDVELMGHVNVVW